jgi:GNAT superfamily N-acetyltransferase
MIYTLLWITAFILVAAIVATIQNLREQLTISYWVRAYLFSLDREFCEQNGGSGDVVFKPGRFRYVATQAMNPVGFVEVMVRRHIVIRRLYVSPPHRRRGVGKMLIQHLLTQHPGLSIMARVDERLLDTCLFFRDSGFVCVSTERDRYGDSDALIFKKREVADGHQSQNLHGR